MLAIKTFNLRKEFITGLKRKKVVALDNLNLDIEEELID